MNCREGILKRVDVRNEYNVWKWVGKEGKMKSLKGN